MTKRQQRQCGDKVGYDQEYKAKRIKKRMMSYGNEPLDIYRCPYCNKWHLGHSPKRRS